MHIIGIRIYEGMPEILKNLKPGWYPFGKYDEPTDGNEFKWRNGSALSDRLYQLYPDMPQISVSCIVGKNGSGKTTLLDVLYRILNNFACTLGPKWGTGRLDLTEAKGLNGRLYFEVNGYIGFIKNTCDGESELYYQINADNRFNRIEQKECANILHELFYTIGVNYSIYSMSFEDDNGEEDYKNKWLEKIYRNIEGNYIPLSFSPDRISGQIDVISEEKNAERRLMTIATLLHSQGNKFLNGYTPIRIEYSINDNYEQEMERILSRFLIPKGLYNLMELIVEEFKVNWQKKLVVGNSQKLIYIKTISSLAWESTYLCFVYKSYGDTLQLAKMKEEYEDKDKIENEGKFVELIDRVLKEQNTTSVLHNIRQVLVYYHSNEPKESGFINIENLCRQRLQSANKPFRSYLEVFELLPPVYFKCSLFFREEGSDNTFKLENMSSGERQMLYNNSAVLYHIINLVNASEDTRIIRYKHINIIYDEVELYAHPEFQRDFIFKLITLLRDIHIDSNLIRSINIIIATHSPFIVSDVPAENILALKNGEVRTINGHTYCANIYDLLKNSFFLDYPMGEAARRRIDDVVQAYNKDDKKMKKKICYNSSFYTYLSNIIADPYLKKSFSLMVGAILNEKKEGLSELLSQKRELENQIDELNKKISTINEEN